MQLNILDGCWNDDDGIVVSSLVASALDDGSRPYLTSHPPLSMMHVAVVIMGAMLSFEWMRFVLLISLDLTKAALALDVFLAGAFFVGALLVDDDDTMVDAVDLLLLSACCLFLC